VIERQRQYSVMDGVDGIVDDQLIGDPAHVGARVAIDIRRRRLHAQLRRAAIYVFHLSEDERASATKP
jgi:hypothetical protein